MSGDPRDPVSLIRQALIEDEHGSTRYADTDRPDLRTAADCPSCGSDDARVQLLQTHGYGSTSRPKKRKPYWQVDCRACGFRGPRRPTMKLALAAWKETRP